MDLSRIMSLFTVFAASFFVSSAWASPQHGISIHGNLKYGPDFKYFDYVNPDAPKGGEVTLSALGTFDNFNQFILKGEAAEGIGNIYDKLMVSSLDEASVMYGLVAQSVEVADDRASVTFGLNPKARFHDGKQIQASDVVFTFNALIEKGHPWYRVYYKDVLSAEAVSEGKVKFSFRDGSNNELPFIVAQLPVLPEHFWKKHDLGEALVDFPLGSGPYRVKSVDMGKRVTYERVEDYWAKDLPVKVGHDNFGQITYDYYRDEIVQFEAFKAGEFDFRYENVSKNWAIGYDFPAVEKGDVIKEELPHQNSTGMQGFVFNTRKDYFKDARVREALAYAFDFEWTNKNLFYGAYTRTNSYFSNSELASRGLPSKEELKYLKPYKDQLPPEVFTKEYQAPVSDGSGNIRGNLRKAVKLLKEAGWVIKDKRLVNAKTGNAFEFEILLYMPMFERIVLPFTKNLERLGIQANIRTVDVAQFTKRTEKFDFDMIIGTFGQSLSPGNEQKNFWGSEYAGIEGSNNVIGIQNPVVDALIEKLINAPDRESLITITRALDRVLLWNHYVIPQYHIRTFRLAYWKKLKHPKVTPKYSFGFMTWWIEPESK